MNSQVFRRYLLEDISLTLVSFLACFLLRYGDLNTEMIASQWHWIVLLICTRTIVLSTIGVYKVIWRFFILRDAIRLTNGIVLSSFLFFILLQLTGPSRVIGFRFVMIECLVALCFLNGIRIISRLWTQREINRVLQSEGKRTFIYGAGRHARILIRQLESDPRSGRHLVGLLDDDPAKLGMTLSGLKVLGNFENYEELSYRLQIQCLIITASTLPAQRLQELINISSRLGIRVQMATSGLTSQKNEGSPIRPLSLSDLLPRKKRAFDLSDVARRVEGATVMVTGAGGSIGSELSRQIAAMGPARLLLVDHSELNLYQIHQELADQWNKRAAHILPILIDLKDRAATKTIFETYSPQLVFHAAAYKHVHLGEMNPYALIRNNILSTRHVLEFSESSGTQTFVMISTDKAVNPTSLMGATKRACELLVTEAAQRTGRQYCSVRFGNVLGSSGSLVPLLIKQIQAGGPITITDERMSRYFMLIEEAVALVLRAAWICRPGDIAILQMGEPFKIIELAKSLVSLMGKNQSEIPMLFTGARPGEKLVEELYICGNELSTEDPDILILPRGDSLGAANRATLRFSVDQIIEAANRSQIQAVQELRDLVSGSRREAPPVSFSISNVRGQTLPGVT